MDVLVLGASRGIGREFVRQYLAAGDRVSATARRADDVAALRRLGADAFALDLADAAAGATLVARVAGQRFDVALLVAGVYGPRSAGLEPPTAAEFDAVMHTNVFGAMQVLPPIAGTLAPGARLAVMSSKMGSIGERRSSAGWLYRASKAALNSVFADVSLTLAGRAVCVAFHPGWVRTDMGGSGADLDVEASVAGMRRTLAALTAADHGRFLNHDGSPIGW